jgi:transposase
MRRQVFDIQDGRTSVIEHRALSVCCHKCGATTKAEFPSGIRAPVQYGPGVLTRASYLHLYQLLPIARTTESMHDLFGCTLAPATVERASRLFSGKLVRCEQRIKAAMDEIGILPQFKGTLVRDGYLSYTRFERCRHSLCNAHLLRELVFIEETDPAQKVWTTPLAKLLLRVKETTDKARAQKEAKLDQREQSAYLRHYDRLVRKAVKLNPPVSRCKGQPGATKKKRIAQPTAYGIIQRLQRRREEILRFMTDLSVPFDNNGSNLEEALDKLHLPYRVSFI